MVDQFRSPACDPEASHYVFSVSFRSFLLLLSSVVLDFLQSPSCWWIVACPWCPPCSLFEHLLIGNVFHCFLTWLWYLFPFTELSNLLLVYLVWNALDFNTIAHMLGQPRDMDIMRRKALCGLEVEKGKYLVVKKYLTVAPMCFLGICIL